MIRNERQLSVSRRKRDAALEAAAAMGHPDNQSYKNFAEDLQQQIDEYLGVRDGHVTLFRVNSIDDLAQALIKARIARRWTQQQLAQALGVTEQMVQRDEAGGYEKAGLARLAEVADVLDYELLGELRPAGSTGEDQGSVAHFWFPVSMVFSNKEAGTAGAVFVAPSVSEPRASHAASTNSAVVRSEGTG